MPTRERKRRQVNKARYQKRKSKNADNPEMSDPLSFAATEAIGVKYEEEEDEDDVIEFPANEGNEEKMETNSNEDREESPITPTADTSSLQADTNTNPNSTSFRYIPSILYDYFRQASVYYTNGDFTCVLCWKNLKCRSARDLRDHALAHGGPAWQSAFRCLLCPYRSHNRRSVTKHIRNSHLIPDGVQCAPGELMENQTIARAEELMELVRQCFPLKQSQSNGESTTNRTSVYTQRQQPHRGRLAYRMVKDTYKMVEQISDTDAGAGFTQTGTGETRTTAVEGQNIKKETNTEMDPVTDDGYGELGDESWPIQVPSENENDCEENNGRTEGWTVMEDADGSDAPGNYWNAESSELNGQDNEQYPAWQTESLNGQNGTATANVHPSMLQGLLRNFKFRSNTQNRSFSSVYSTSFQSNTTEGTDDPRALIERLLDVVKPDVARFLLEEAIQNRQTLSTAKSQRIVQSVTKMPMGDTASSAPVALPVVSQRTIIRQTPRDTQALLAGSKQKQEPKPRAYKCNECNTYFKLRRYLERHVRARHKLHLYRCTLEGCNFANGREMWDLRRHHAKHHSMATQLICKFCSKRFPTSDELTSRHHPCCLLSSSIKPAEAPVTLSKTDHSYVNKKKQAVKGGDQPDTNEMEPV